MIDLRSDVMQLPQVTASINNCPCDNTLQPAKKRNLNHIQLFYGAVFKIRGLLMVPAIVAMFFLTQGEWQDAVSAWLVGLPIFLLGAVLRVWSQRHLKYRLRQKTTLITSGPYAWVRNPVYVGNMLILAGLSAMCKLIWLAPFIVVWAAVVYSLAIRFEELRLTRRHLEVYTAYCQRVHRWWPYKSASDGDDGNALVSWIQSMAVEWQCLLLLAIPSVKAMIIQ